MEILRRFLLLKNASRFVKKERKIRSRMPPEAREISPFTRELMDERDA